MTEQTACQCPYYYGLISNDTLDDNHDKINYKLRILNTNLTLFG
jgi:hypothetical protein